MLYFVFVLFLGDKLCAVSIILGKYSAILYIYSNFSHIGSLSVDTKRDFTHSTHARVGCILYPCYF